MESAGTRPCGADPHVRKQRCHEFFNQLSLCREGVVIDKDQNIAGGSRDAQIARTAIGLHALHHSDFIRRPCLIRSMSNNRDLMPDKVGITTLIPAIRCPVPAGSMDPDGFSTLPSEKFSNA